MVGFSLIAGPLHDVLISAGFSRLKKRVWYRRSQDSQETAQAVNIDKSSYGPQNYTIVYIDIDLVQHGKSKALHLYPIVLQYSRICTEKALMKSLLDQEAEIPDDVRTREITRIALQDLVPILNKCSSMSGLLQMRRSFPSRNDLNFLPRVAALMNVAQ